MTENNLSIFEEFTKIAANYGSKTAILFEQNRNFKSISYSDLLQEAIQIGNFLSGEGIKKSDRVAILLSNQPEWPISFLALQYLGAIAVPIDTKLPLQDLKQIITHSGTKNAICSKNSLPNLYENLCRIKELNILCIDDNKFIESFKKASPKIPDKKTYSLPDEPAAIFYTSGTTDTPKGVVLSHSNFLANINSINKLNISSHKDIIISFLPLHHTYPFTVTCLLPLMQGAIISYPSSFNPEDLLRCLKNTKTTVLIGVPQFFTILHSGINKKLNRLNSALKVTLKTALKASLPLRKYFGKNLGKIILSEAHKTFGGNLRFMISGGARLDPNIAADFYKWGFSILEGYGLTETAPILTLNPIKKAKFGSVGKAVPFVQIKIHQPDKNGIGEVIAQGKNIMTGYYKNPEETNKVIRDGWFFTGDLGYMDKDEYLFLTGRKDELLVLSSGKKINPEDVERLYETSPYIKEVCVFLSEKKGTLETTKKLMAIIVPNEDYFRARGLVNIEEKIKWELDNISHRLAPHKRIQGFHITTNKLPRTSLGKIMRHKIEESYTDEMASAPKKQKAVKEIDVELLSYETNRKILCYLTQRLKKEVHLDDHLELDLGLDSLGRVEIFLDIQQYLNIEITDTLAMELFYANTIRDLLLKLKPLFEKEETLQIKEKEFIWAETLKQPPTDITLRSIILAPNKIHKIVSFFFRCFLDLIFFVFFRIEIKGRENLPEKGPFIIYPNHTSYLDGFIIARSLNFKQALNTYFLVFGQYINIPVIKSLAKMLRLIPVSITLDIMDMLKTCSYLLTHSKSICYFPEGERTADGEIIKFKKGIGILAKEMNVTLIPAYIEGAFYAWSRHSMLPRPAKIKVTFGEKTSLEKINPEGKVLSYEEVAEELQKILKELKNKNSG